MTPWWWSWLLTVWGIAGLVLLAQLGAVADETLSVLRDIRELLTEPEDAP